MTDVYRSFQTSEKGVLRESFKGMEWRFMRLIIGSFLINFFKERLTPILFGPGYSTK
jgi:hypothetical protein